MTTEVSIARAASVARDLVGFEVLVVDQDVAVQRGVAGLLAEASVHTTGTGQGVQIVGRWTFQDGQVVDERTESISPTGDAYTEFHIAKPSGWPAGKYTLHVLVNGQEVQTKDFTVK